MTQATTITSEEIGHSPTGASGASRWLNCPGSIQIAKKLGVYHSKSGFAADQGTAAHEVLSRCLEANPMREPWEFLGTKVKVHEQEFEVDQNMVDALNVAFLHIEKRINAAYDKCEGDTEPMFFIEESMKHSDHEMMFGTTDCGIAVWIASEESVDIEINDYKHGMGVYVEADTPQTKYYACLIADRLMQDRVIRGWHQIRNVTLTIIQPRIPSTEGVIRSITMSGEELKHWYDTVLVPGLKETENPDAVLQMGKWCDFCPVKDRCPAMAQAMLSVSTAKAPQEMTNEELGKTLEQIIQIAKLKEKYEKEVFARCAKGEKVHGFKLVKQKANRAWRDEAELELMFKFGDKAYHEPKLKSPADVETMPDGKNFVAQYAYSPDTGLTIAPMTDKRKEAKPLMNAFVEFCESFDEGLD